MKKQDKTSKPVKLDEITTPITLPDYKPFYLFGMIVWGVAIIIFLLEKFLHVII